jgi:hypothetical protein
LMADLLVNYRLVCFVFCVGRCAFNAMEPPM